ncbi:MAG: chemotaxis response regulator protein-glutamate methylesterase [Pseudomonadales bacterium]|nr:chemotaxis response regulator protein-glutamate methylesterase [Pseudomonadales bacterium]
MIKVFIVDDSALIRALLTEILSKEDDIEVVGTAPDPLVARNKIKDTNPDVLTLDIEMPHMDGISFLKNLMRLRPMPVVMISTLTEKGAPATLEALALGAVDFVGKPKTDLNNNLHSFSEEITEKVRAAAQANVRALESTPVTRRAAPALSAPAGKKLYVKPGQLVAIGASTGGTEAIKTVLIELPENSPPFVLAQHIPANFSKSYAQRLDDNCAIAVFEAEHQQPIKPGCAYLAPGDFHLRVQKSHNEYICMLDQKEKESRHRPSVDALFNSVAGATKGHATGVLLTGMGADGAQGLLAMKKAGCMTLVQDEASSVVWGMPGSAVKINAHDEIVSLHKIAAKIMSDSMFVKKS